MKYIFWGAIAYVLLSLTACNTTRFVKPLAKKQVAVGVDFGGPLIDFVGAKIPVPFSSITTGYGIDSTLTAFAGFHTTAIAFGTVQLDLGVVKELYRSRKAYIPSISVAPVVNMMLDGFDGNFRAYPQVDVNFYWQYWKDKPHYFYVSVNSWFDFYPKVYTTLPTNIYQPAFALGHTFENKKMRYTLEAKYMGVNENSGGSPVVYNGIGGKGSFGVYLSIFRKF